MRKKTVTHSIKTIFWYIIYMLPILSVLVAWFSSGDFFVNAGWDSFSSYFEYEIANYIDFRNPIYTTLYDIISEDGFIPIFKQGNSGFVPIIGFMAWFVGTYLMHLLVDFILFIPRLCHKFMNKFTRSEDCE